MFYLNQKNKVFYFFLICFLFIFLILLLKNKGTKYEAKKIILKNEEFFVEIANNNKKRALGLGNKNYLCDKCGMLFVFPQEDFHSFWMKNMNFDLDILWLNKGKIVFIEQKISHQNQEKIYKPEIKSDSVLEINSGLVEKLEIKVGDEISF